MDSAGNPIPGTSGAGATSAAAPTAADGGGVTDGGGNSDGHDAWADATEDGDAGRLTTRSSSYSRADATAGSPSTPNAGKKGKGGGKKSVKDPVLAEKQKDAVETWAAEVAAAMQRAAVLVGDPNAAAPALDAAVTELVQMGARGVALETEAMSSRGRRNMELLRDRRKAELEASLGILRSRRAGGGPPALAAPGGGGSAAGTTGGTAGGPTVAAAAPLATAGAGAAPVEDPFIARLRSLSESAAYGPGFGFGRGRGGAVAGGAGGSSTGGGTTTPVGGTPSWVAAAAGPGVAAGGAAAGGAASAAASGDTGGSPWGGVGGTAVVNAVGGEAGAGSSAWDPLGFNHYAPNLDHHRPEFWLEFPPPWNVVPKKVDDLKPGDVFKITVANLPKFTGNPEEYVPWRGAFLPCVHATPIDISLKIMTLMGTLIPRTAQLREIRTSFTGNAPGYRATISLLERTFGGAHNLLVSRQQALLSIPQLREGNFAGLETLHIRLGTFLMEWGGGAGGGEASSLAFFHILMGKLEANFARKFEGWAQQQGRRADLSSLHAWAGKQLEVHRRVETYSRQLLNLGGMSSSRGGLMGGVGHPSAPPPRWPYGGAGGRPAGRGAPPPGAGGSGGAPLGAQHTPWTHLYEQEEGGWHEVEEDFGGEEGGEGHYLHGGGENPAAPSCGLCQGEHLLGRCPKFRGMTPQERRDWLAEQGRCYSCFQRGHNIRNCRLQYRCKKCGDPHNTALHGSRRRNSAPAGGEAPGAHLYAGGGGDVEGAEWEEEHVFHHRQGGRESVSLRTVGLWLGNPRSGREEYVTALLDDGSTGSVLVSDELARALQLTGHLMRTVTEGVGGKLTTAESLMSTVRVRSQD